MLHPSWQSFDPAVEIDIHVVIDHFSVDNGHPCDIGHQGWCEIEFRVLGLDDTDITHTLNDEEWAIVEAAALAHRRAV